MSIFDDLRAKRAPAATPIALPLAPLATPEQAAAIEDTFRREDAANGAPLLATPDPDEFAPVPVASAAPLVAMVGEDRLDLGDFAPEPVKIGLAANSLLVNLTVHFWTAKKKDDEATRKTNAAAGAREDAGAYIKNILDPKLLEVPATAASKVRTYVESMTVVWQRGGIRLLPAVKLAEFRSEVRRLIAEFDHTADVLASQYASARDDDAARLGTMFVNTEYPSVEEVRRRYRINVDIYPVPDAGHFLVDLQQEEVQRLRDEFQGTYGRAVAAMRADLAEQVAAPVRAMAKKLRDYKVVADPSAKKGSRTEGTFRDSLVENVREMVAKLKVYNVAGDEDIESVVADVERDLAPHSPETLRSDAYTREQTAKKADAILAKMSALFSPSAG